jgi:rod shape-determining protein MreC
MRMRDFFYRLRVPLLFAGLLLCFLVTLLADRRALREGERDWSYLPGFVIEIAAPIEEVVLTPFETVRDAWRSYVALLEVREENEQLWREVVELREENLQFREALVASENLQRIVEMRAGFEIPMRPAEVVGQDLSIWFRSILLDRGQRAGVYSGMPVVTGSGVVGLVTATSPHAAKVMLLQDRQSAIDGIVQRSRARGIVRGHGDDALIFELVVRGDDVRPGDVVISSGIGGVYPKGLRIGEVIEVADPEAGLVQKARLAPAVDFGRLEQVFVLLRRAPTMDLLYGVGGDRNVGSAVGSEPRR